MPISIADDAAIEIVFKIQETCNINCTYCYMYNVGNNLHKELPQHASEDVFAAVAEFVCNEFDRRNPRFVRVIMHGGEPMLYPLNKLEKNLEIMRSILLGRLNRDSASRITFAMQTNAMLVNEEWIRFLERWGILVGVSIDGPPAVHDRFRVDKRSRGTYERVAAGIKLLMKANAEGRIGTVGALCVVTPGADGSEVYSHLCKDLGFTGIDFLIPFMNWDDYDSKKVAGVTSFLASAFDEWESHLETKDVRVRIFDRVIESLCSNPLVAEEKEEMSLGNHIVVVESDGSIMPEESLRPTYSGRFSDLSIFKSTALDMINEPSTLLTLTEELRLAPECSGCAVATACASGGTLGRIGTRYSSDREYQRKSVYCQTFVELYVRAAKLLNKSGATFTPNFVNDVSPHSECLATP